MLGIGLTQQVPALPSRRPWERVREGFWGKARRWFLDGRLRRGRAHAVTPAGASLEPVKSPRRAALAGSGGRQASAAQWGRPSGWIPHRTGGARASPLLCLVLLPPRSSHLLPGLTLTETPIPSPPLLSGTVHPRSPGPGAIGGRWPTVTQPRLHKHQVQAAGLPPRPQPASGLGSDWLPLRSCSGTRTLPLLGLLTLRGAGAATRPRPSPEASQ